MTSAVVSMSTISLAQVGNRASQPAATESCPAARSDVARTTMVHEPGAGQSTDITPNPQKALSFDFSPFDAQAFHRGRDLRLRFADNGVLVLRRVFREEAILPIPVHLPDGTVISLCELLRAMPKERAEADARKIPTGKIPAEELDRNQKIPSERNLVQ
jgi:hypothetical protein